MSKNRQILPFDLPEYLATYYGNKLSTNPDQYTNGSYETPFYVDSFSSIGKFILEQLEPTSIKPKKVNTIPFYISVSNLAGNNKKEIPQGRLTFLRIRPEGLEKITNRLKELFEFQLMSYISGAESVYKSEVENKRIRTKAIRRFCEENNVFYTPQNMEAWKKQHQRQKNKRKRLVYMFL